MKRNLLLLLAIPAVLCAQTTINGSRIIKGSLDASGSTRSLPNRTGTGSPTGRDNCASPGETYFQTDATPGQNLWACTAAGTPGTWSQISGGTGGSSPAVVTGTTSPNGACSAGAFYLRTDVQELYVCSSTNAWELASYASGSTQSRPLGCASGQLFVATDTGDLWYCAVPGSLGTWQPVTPLTNVSLNGVAQGAFSSLNLVNAPGLTFNLNPNGQTLAIAPMPDTTYLLSQTAAQNASPFLCVPSSNNTSAYTCSLTPTPPALSNGMSVEFRPDVSCAGGATTLNINGLGPKPIYSLDGASNPAANDCRVNRPTWLVYSTALNGGTGAFVMQSLANLPSQGGGGQVTSVFNQIGSVPNLSGDVTTNNSSVTTLATVNVSPGTCGDASHVCQVTTNAKGLVTAQSAVAIPSSGGNASFSYTALGTVTSNVIFTRSSNIQEWSFTLGANATSTLPGATAGDQYSFNACQGASTSYTFSWPAGFSQAPAVPTDTGFCVHFTGIWDGANLQLSSPASTTYAPFLISGAPERGAPSNPTGTLENIWADSGRRTLVALNGAGNTHIMPRTAGATDQLSSTDLSDTANLARVTGNNTYASGTTQDAHAATHTLPAASGSTLPPTCTVGEQFFNTQATAGQNLYFCTSTNNWTQQSGGGSGGGGSVTSVALTMPPGFSVSGSPVTGAGTLAVTANTESANTVYAGPGSGSAAAPTFRALIPTDIPTLNQNTTGNAATASALAATPYQCSGGQFATGITANGNANCSTPSGGSGMTWPSSAGVPNYSGSSSWGTSYTVGTAANNLVQLNSSSQLPAVNGANLTGLSNINSGPTNPGSCAIGQIFFNTNAAAGSNLYLCTATNLWTQMSGSGGSSTVTEYTYIPFNTQYSTSANANSATGAGGARDTTDSTGTTPQLNVGAGYGYGGITYNSSTTKPTSPDYYYFTWMLPQNWTGNINVVLQGVSNQTTQFGNAYIKIAVACNSGSTSMQALSFNADSTGLLNYPSVSYEYKPIYLTLNSLSTTGCTGGNTIVFRVGRDASQSTDTLQAGIVLMGMQVQWQHN